MIYRRIWQRGSLGLTLVLGLVACSDAPPPGQSMSLTPEPASAADSEAERDARPTRRPATVRTVVDEEANRPPALRSLVVVPLEADPTLWEARIEAYDPDGDDVTLEIVWVVNGEPTAQGERTFDPTAHRRGDEIHVEVTPHDGKVAGSTSESGHIELANAAPTITSQPPASMHDGVYRYVVEAKDPENDSPIRYELAKSPDGMRIDPFNGELTWRPSASQAGEHTVEIVVSDDRGGKSTQEFVLPIMGPPGSAPAAPAP